MGNVVKVTLATTPDEGVIESAGELVERAIERARRGRWFRSRGDVSVIKDSADMVRVLAHRLRAANRINDEVKQELADRNADIERLRDRVTSLESHCKNATSHLSECRTLHTKLSEAMSAARRETHNAVNPIVLVEASE